MILLLFSRIKSKKLTSNSRSQVVIQVVTSSLWSKSLRNTSNGGGDDGFSRSQVVSSSSKFKYNFKSLVQVQV